MLSQIQDAGGPHIGREEEDNRVRAFAGPKLFLATDRPVGQQQTQPQQRQEEIGDDGGDASTRVCASSSSLPGGPLRCEGSDAAIIVASTAEAINIANSANGKFYANLVSVPFWDDRPNTGMPVDIFPHPMMQIHRQQHLGSLQGGGGGGGGGGGHAPLDRQRMLINDASLSSSTSDGKGDKNVDLYYDNRPDMLDNLSDEFDNYKNQVPRIAVQHNRAIRRRGRRHGESCHGARVYL